jgi:N-acyl-D-amino-acid deacylase
MSPSRRTFLAATAAGAVLSSLPAVADQPAPLATGNAVPELAPFDAWMQAFMTEHVVPGGQLAVMRSGKLVYSRGFGIADREAPSPVETTSLFRIASVSKPITAVAILRLVQQKKLTLDDRIVDVLKIEPHLETNATADPRWENITVGHCLAHTGGWNRDASYDPMFAYERIAKSLGVKLPIGTAEIIRYMRGQPLDSEPGAKYAYSNFGYCLLGRVIEKLAGKTYEAFVKQQVFAPLEITAPRIGASLAEQRAEREVRYYTASDEQATPMVGPHAGDTKQRVPLPYGGWNQEALDAHGGWITSCEDLVRFAAAFDDVALQSSQPLLGEALVRQMFAPHATVRVANKDRGDAGAHYGLGWIMGTFNRQPLIAHGGALPCTASALVKLPGDLNIAVLFNLGKSKGGKFLGGGLDGQLAALAAGIAKWP